MSNYYIKGTEEVSQNKKILFCKLKRFYEYNKGFGRRCIKLTSKRCFLTNKTKITKETLINIDHVSFYNIKLTDDDFTYYNNYIRSLRYRNSSILYNMVVQTNNNTAEQITVVDEWQVTVDDLESNHSDDYDSSDYNDDDSSIS